MKNEKLLVIGSGNPHSVSFNTSILVKDDILLDAPPGVEKIIMHMKKNLKSLKIILVSHIHGDHTLGLPQLLVYCGRVLRRIDPLYIIGPAELENNLRSIFDLTFPGEADEILKSAKVEFVTLTDSIQDITLLEYNISCLKMSHGNINNYGFLISTNSKIIGYSGDTGQCDNLELLVERADHVFLDTTFMVSRKTHTGVDYIEELASRLKGIKKLYAIHIGDETEHIKNLPGIIFPKSGDEYEI